MIPAADSDPTICRKCGARALPGQEFAGPGHTGPALCPDCVRSQFMTGGYSMMVAWAVMPLAGWALVSSGNTDSARAGWVILNLFGGWVIGVLLTIPHELAHAVMARALGHRIKRIVIGYGPTVLRLRPGFPVELRMIPLGGYCSFRPRRGPYRPAHDFWISAAGPLSHLIMLLGGWALMGFPSITTLDPTRGLALGWMFLGWNLADFFWNAVPAVGHIEGSQLIGNDGLQALHALQRIRGEKNTREPFGPAGPREKPPVKPAAARRIAVWLGFVAGIAGLFSVTRDLRGDGQLTTGDWWQLIGWGLLAGCCLRLGLRYEVAVDAPELSRRIRAAESPEDTLAEMVRREHAAAVSPDREAALSAAVSECVSLLDAEDWPALRDAARRHLEPAGQHPAVQHWLARALIGCGELEEARRILLAMLDAPETRPATAAHTVELLADLEAAAGNTEALAAHVDDFTRLEPSPALRLAVLVHAASRVWEHPLPALIPQALEWVDQMLQIQPGAPAFLIMKAVLLAEAGRFEESAAARTAGDQKHPVPEIHALRCFAAALQAAASGDLAGAEKLLHTARLLHPEPWLEKRAATLLGKSLISKNSR